MARVQGFLTRAVARVLSAATVALCLTSAFDPALAAKAPTVLPSLDTSISGTADRLISYRHQNHMWQTADGATHVLVNTGTQPDRRSLQLYSSPDNGVTWTANLGLGGSGFDATSDGILIGNDLYVTYSTISDGVGFAVLHYDADTRTWTRTLVETAYLSTNVIAQTPALARDTAGRTWIAFTAQDRTTLEYSIRMLRKSSDASAWVDTGFVFGTPDNVSNERSARPVAVNDGVTMVFMEHQYVYWATRQDAWDENQAWTVRPLYTSVGGDIDPYGSHYNIAKDAAGNLHMASVDGGRLMYFRLLKGQTTWTWRYITDAIKATYVQTVVIGPTLMMMTNWNTQVRVFQSTDGGASWQRTNTLTHPLATAGVSYDNPRMEAPSESLSPVPVLQQYVDGALQRAMQFQVPALTPAP